MVDKETKNLIEEYLYYSNGLKHINGADVQVVNVKYHKRKKEYEFDVIYLNDIDKMQTRMNDVALSEDLVEGLR